MSNERIIPANNNEFNTYAGSAIAYLTDADNAKRLNVSPDNVKLLGNLGEQWSENWKAFTTPSLHTSIVTKTKDSLHKKIAEALRGVYADIPESALTIQDRDVLNLKERDTHYTRVPVMGNAPTLLVADMLHLQHGLHFSNPATPDSDAMPYGQHIVLEYFMGAAGLPDTAIGFGNAKNVTRAK